jgi:hypothetical protein
VVGGAAYTVEAYQWEVLARGVSEVRRGVAFSFAYGLGPVLACLSSLGSQLVLKGELAFGPDLVLRIRPIDYPWNFGILFGLTLPIMTLPALLSTQFVIPAASTEIRRQPFVQGIFGGFDAFLRNPLLLTTALAYILVASGFNIINNMTLYTPEALQAPAEDYVGYQNALRFGFKSVAGVGLGWLVVRAGPKACLLATTGLCLAGVVWAMGVHGLWFLFAFCLMGGGELNGWYFPNYIVQASDKAHVRRNAALSSIMNMPSAFAGVFYGYLAHRYSFALSFDTAVLVLIATLLLIQVGLPARPRPVEAKG